MPWPNTERFGCKIVIAFPSRSSMLFDDADKSQRSVCVEETSDNAKTEHLAEFGFVKEGRMWFLKQRASFKLSELAVWFPGLTKADIDPLVGTQTTILKIEPSETATPPDAAEHAVPEVPATNKDLIEETAEEPAAPRIEDAGEKIGGAVKDTRGNGGKKTKAADPRSIADIIENYAEQVIRPSTETNENGDPVGYCFAQRAIDDIEENLDHADIVRSLSISELWPRPPFAEAREQGIGCDIAFAIHKIRKDITMRPSETKHISAKGALVSYAFIRRAGRIFDLSTIKTADDLLAACKDFVESAEFSLTSESYISPRVYQFVSSMLRVKAGGLSYAPFYDKHLATENDENKKEHNEWRRERSERFWKQMGVTTKTGDDLTREVKTGPAAPERPHLDHLESSFAPDHDITTDEFMKEFGFRAVEWGEWIPQKERQIVLNEAYGACAALSEAIGSPRKCVSLDGTLAAAFGSRGRGGKGSAMAHYEPARKVFNLTRFNGAGSMAHEWGHALDHYLSGLYGAGSGEVYLSDKTKNHHGWNDISRTMKQFMQSTTSSENKKAWATEIAKVVEKRVHYAESWVDVGECIRKEKDSRRAEVRREILKTIMENGDVIFAKPTDREADIETLDPAYNIADTLVSVFMKDGAGALAPKSGQSIDVSLDYYEMLKFANREFGAGNSLARRQNKAERNFDGNCCGAIAGLKRIAVDGPKIVESNYLKEAKKLDEKKSKDYWSTPHEMFARAFESFVFDTLKQNGLRCDYLVHGVDGLLHSNSSLYTGNPYPSGDERESINGKMVEFIKEARGVLLSESTGDNDELGSVTRVRNH